jgi:hypothetical protein
MLCKRLWLGSGFGSGFGSGCGTWLGSRDRFLRGGTTHGRYEDAGVELDFYLARVIKRR